MKSCAFFGHRDFCYGEYKEEIEKILTELIEKENVMQFYCGGRGDFDRICAEIVFNLKKAFSAYQKYLGFVLYSCQRFFLTERI